MRQWRSGAVLTWLLRLQLLGAVEACDMQDCIARLTLEGWVLHKWLRALFDQDEGCRVCQPL